MIVIYLVCFTFTAAAMAAFIIAMATVAWTAGGPADAAIALVLFGAICALGWIAGGRQ